MARVFAECDVDNEEKALFESALNICRSRKASNRDMLKRLKVFVEETENRYHPDQQGKFAELWPELGSLLNVQ